MRLESQDNKNANFSAEPVLLPLFATVEYPNYNQALGMIQKMVEYHKMCRIIGHPGSGKTRILLEYKKQKNPDAHLICPLPGCTPKDLIRLLGTQIGFYPERSDSKVQSISKLIDYINDRGKDVTFLIDEADNLCSREEKIIKNILKLEDIRAIWDKTRLHTSFIFAAPYDLEVRLQHSSEAVTCSQFYRRCKIHTLTCITETAARLLLEKTEQEFHLSISPTAKLLLLNRISMSDRGGLGITLDALEQCLMFALPNWNEYYKMIEMSTPREEALKVFDGSPTVTLSEDLVADALEMCR